MTPSDKGKHSVSIPPRQTHSYPQSFRQTTQCEHLSTELFMYIFLCYCSHIHNLWHFVHYLIHQVHRYVKSYTNLVLYGCPHYMKCNINNIKEVKRATRLFICKFALAGTCMWLHVLHLNLFTLYTTSPAMHFWNAKESFCKARQYCRSGERPE